jgi:pyruvate/2-oxoglutarate/acetoin dehydrogenase E1 component
MKKLNIYALVMTFLFVSCSKDDDPVAVNEEEVITTLTVTLIPSDASANIILKTQDLDGDGPNAPVVTVSGDLKASLTYAGSMKFENETETPPDNITLEIIEEADEHQVFYTVASGLSMIVTSTKDDSAGNPLGTEFNLSTNVASTGKLTFTLRHEPKKPNTGLADAGGSTDIEATFDLVIK